MKTEFKHVSFKPLSVWAARVGGERWGVNPIRKLKPKRSTKTFPVITEMRDVNNNIIELGQTVAFNHSGAVRVGTVVKIGTVRANTRRIQFELEKNMPVSTINVDVQRFNGGVSTIKKKESVHILTKAFLEQF